MTLLLLLRPSKSSSSGPIPPVLYNFGGFYPNKKKKHLSEEVQAVVEEYEALAEAPDPVPVFEEAKFVIPPETIEAIRLRMEADRIAKQVALEEELAAKELALELEIFRINEILRLQEEERQAIAEAKRRKEILLAALAKKIRELQEKEEEDMIIALLLSDED